VPPAFAGFAFFGNLAILTVDLADDFRPFGFASPDFAGFAFSRSAILLLHAPERNTSCLDKF
jgi:hypothetical protein